MYIMMGLQSLQYVHVRTHVYVYDLLKMSSWAAPCVSLRWGFGIGTPQFFFSFLKFYALLA